MLDLCNFFTITLIGNAISVLLWPHTDVQVDSLKTYAVKRPESAALVHADDNEVSKVDLAKVEEDKSEDNISIGESYTGMVSTTIIHFDVQNDDLEKDYNDLTVNESSQSKASQMSLQVIPEVGVDHTLLQEKEDRHFSYISVDDEIPLI